MRESKRGAKLYKTDIGVKRREQIEREEQDGAKAERNESNKGKVALKNDRDGNLEKV